MSACAEAAVRETQVEERRLGVNRPAEGQTRSMLAEVLMVSELLRGIELEED